LGWVVEVELVVAGAVVVEVGAWMMFAGAGLEAGALMMFAGAGLEAVVALGGLVSCAKAIEAAAKSAVRVTDAVFMERILRKRRTGSQERT
jgi:hypothetical protein